jgi:CheY-like chemotaxis protein
MTMQTPGATPHVLIVEDDPDTRAVLRSVLEDEGYAVVEAADGHRGLAVLRECNRPLVVLLDQGMPGMTGTELLENVLSGGYPADERSFLLLTASPDRLPTPFNQPYMQQVVPVVAKPFALATLLELVAEAARRLEGAWARELSAAASGQ